MQANRADSGPERRLRSELHHRGLRFRKHLAVLPGVRCRPDVVFITARLVVFVDGCFWHSCPQHATVPKANRQWWTVKLAATAQRDRRNDRDLALAGWEVLRLWEHEDASAMAEQVQAALDRRPRCHLRPAL